MNRRHAGGLAAIALATLWVGCDREPLRSGDSATTAEQRPEPQSASWITTKIQAQYFANPDIKPWNIDVTTTGGGHVSLRGEVDTAGHRDLAVRIARQTEGVTEVEDLLRVKGEAVATSGGARPSDADAVTITERPDSWITTKIQAKYFTDDEVRATAIDVDTQGGVVTLRGAVDRYAARRQAVALARNTDGVREVRDEIRVESTDERSLQAAHEDDAGNPIDDAWIEMKLNSKYFLDPDVKGRDVDVAVAGGVVTLTGTVETDQQKSLAEQIAGETEGVTEIRNELQVSGRAPK